VTPIIGCRPNRGL